MKKLIIIAVSILISCAPVIVNLAPINKVIKINKSKHELISIIRSTASNHFVSAKSVIDNVDTANGIIHIDFSIDMGAVWGIPVLGAKGVLDRNIYVKYDVFVKDSAFKIDCTFFKSTDQGAIESYAATGKTDSDYSNLQNKTLINFCNAIIKANNAQKDKWDF